MTLLSLWNETDCLSRVPDESLLDGDEGRAERRSSNRLTATRDGDATLAMIYSANGRAIRVRLDKLRGSTMNALWFNPRTGQWSLNGEESLSPRPFATGLAVGPQASVREFAPPGSQQDGIDWVLVLNDAGYNLRSLPSPEGKP